MNPYLKDLMARLLDRSDQIMNPGYDSSYTIRWKALRESEKIDNADYIPELIDYIDSQKDKKARDKAYFILGHIAKNTQNRQATQYLISRLDKEKD